MKKLILLICLFITFIFSTKQASAQTSGDGYLMITVYESMHQDFTKIIVTENGAKIQEVQLRSVITKELEYNVIQINNVLDKYKKAGYKLVAFSKGSTNLAPGNFGMITTYILEKE